MLNKACHHITNPYINWENNMTTEQGLRDQQYLAKVGKRKRWNNHSLFASRNKNISIWDIKDIPTKSTKLDIPFFNGKPVVEMEDSR